MDDEDQRRWKKAGKLASKMLMAVDDEEDKFTVILAAASITGYPINCYVDNKEQNAVIKEAIEVVRYYACVNIEEEKRKHDFRIMPTPVDTIM
jgi:hypothetical protein